MNNIRKLNIKIGTKSNMSAKMNTCVMKDTRIFANEHGRTCASVNLGHNLILAGSFLSSS